MFWHQFKAAASEICLSVSWSHLFPKSIIGNFSGLFTSALVMNSCLKPSNDSKEREEVISYTRIQQSEPL